MLDDGACRVVRTSAVLVEYRWGRLSVRALDAIFAAYREMLAQDDGPLWGVVVLAPDADIPTAAVRLHQKEVLGRIASDGRMQVALVIEGAGVFAHLGRTLVTSMTPDTLCYRDAAEAARELARHPGAPDAEHVLALIDLARAGHGTATR